MGATNYLQPRVPYVFTDTEKRSVMETISQTKTPFGYASSIHKHFGENKFEGLKSHDHHVLLQDLLMSSIRGHLHSSLREAIIRLGNLFKRICAKVIKRDKMEDLLNFRRRNSLPIWIMVPTRVVWHHVPLAHSPSSRIGHLWAGSR